MVLKTEESTVKRIRLEMVLRRHDWRDFCKAIDKIPWKAACGPDGWCARLVKGLREPLAKWLEKVYDNTMDAGSFPSILKETYIMGIFKGGDRSAPKNYRLIALTSHLSKILERVIKLDLVEYMTEYSL